MLCVRLNSLNMISMLGIFSCSKLQTSPEATASSWGLAHDYNGGPKLVHYNYTVLFIYSMFYKLAVPFLVSFRLPSSFACVPCVLQLSRHGLALTQQSGLGPDPVSERCDVS